jgi:hypothetical protein
MTTVYFTRNFVRGTLAGLTHDDKITFVTMGSAIRWLKAIERLTEKKSLVWTISKVEVIDET